MLRIVLAALTALPLFSAPAVAGKTYASLSEARAAHPGARPGYRVLNDGSRCWYVGAKPSKAKCASSLGAPRIAKKASRRALAAADDIEALTEALCGSTCPPPGTMAVWGARPAVPHTAVSAVLWYYVGWTHGE